MAAYAPAWSEEIRSLYLSGAASQFILHGNVDDRLILPSENEEEIKLGTVTDFLLGHQLRKFDAILAYDLGHGLQVQTPTALGKKAWETWPSNRTEAALPREPRDAIVYMDHFLRYCVNLRQLPSAANSALAGKNVSLALIVRAAGLVVPRSNLSIQFELHASASLIRSWSTESRYDGQYQVSFLVTDNLNDLHPLVANNPRVARIPVPLPPVEELRLALRLLRRDYPRALSAYEGREEIPAQRLAGATLSSVEALVKARHFHDRPLDEPALAELKKDLVENDCQGLIEFIEPTRTLEDVYGNEAIKQWMRQDIALWKKDDLKALPMGYLLCGPVGTGKTFLVECLAGEASVPVVKFRNFRDRWVGSTEGNLEKIFALLHALGRCIVFIDEADQALGSRGTQSGDSGVNNRVYSMMATEMSNTRNRGKILWILASSRPDLIEVDLKRPGRVDVKIPIFPSVDANEAYALIRALCKRQGLELPKGDAAAWGELIPPHLTPGAAEAIAVNVYRMVRTQEGLGAADALREVLSDYQAPVAAEVMDFQIGLAVKEASDLRFVPEVFRGSV